MAFGEREVRDWMDRKADWNRDGVLDRGEQAMRAYYFQEEINKSYSSSYRDSDGDDFESDSWDGDGGDYDSDGWDSDGGCDD